MGRKKKRRITSGGNIGSTNNTIVLTAPNRFGIDIETFIQSIRLADNVDYSRRHKLFDLYTAIEMDTHLTSVMEKRINAIVCSPIEFKRNGKVDDKVNEHIRSPWFIKFLADALSSKFYGFSLFQFYKEGKSKWMKYDLIPRKHVDPYKEVILRRQSDMLGMPWSDFSDLLFVGEKDDLGMLAKAAPWVIYKRNTTGDWAQFSEIFGMPIREYLYDGDDDEARARIEEDALNQGSAGVYIHTKDSSLKFVESGNKSGSSDLYDRFVERSNKELSKLFLGNTLTTEEGRTGTQALGKVHQNAETEKTLADKLFILNLLNYEMTDIFNNFGINTDGGEFSFVSPEKIDLDKFMEILLKAKQMGVPIDDDFIYEKFGIEKPKDYNKKKEKDPNEKVEPNKEDKPTDNPDNNDPDKPVTKRNNKPGYSNKAKKSFLNRLFDFFVQAPRGNGARLKF